MTTLTGERASVVLPWRCGGRILECGARPLIMGILNVTPDSFFDGGRYLARERAVERGLRMLAEGADIIDIGGESSRPFAEPVSEKEEIGRTIPVIERLHAKAAGAAISVDTTKSEVARLALSVGACIVNDISALTADSRMADVVGGFRAGIVLMHMRGDPGNMQNAPCYTDVAGEVAGYIEERIAAVTARGIDGACTAVDPGIGFGKTVEHNLDLLRRLEVLRDIGRPVIIGASRKSFLGKLTGVEVEERMVPSIAALCFCVMKGVHVLRVHDVKESVAAVEVMTALAGAEG